MYLVPQQIFLIQNEAVKFLFTPPDLRSHDPVLDQVSARGNPAIFFLRLIKITEDKHSSPGYSKRPNKAGCANISEGLSVVNISLFFFCFCVLKCFICAQTGELQGKKCQFLVSWDL